MTGAIFIQCLVGIIFWWVKITGPESHSMLLSDPHIKFHDLCNLD
jgi:hypothetical protein